jgi:hypothetical protein
MPFSLWNFSVRKQILQLDRRPHANRLKSVPRPPMSQHNSPTDFVRVKYFNALLSLGQTAPLSFADAPLDLRIAEFNFTGFPNKFHCGLSRIQARNRFGFSKAQFAFGI